MSNHFFITLLLFIVIFGIVVVSHEFGHFLLAKVNGIHVVEFSVGMGPKIISWGKKDTLYSIRLLPIGGACMFEGEDGLETKEDQKKSDKGAFPDANVWARISTVFAGPFFNFILAFLMALVMVQLVVVRDPVIGDVSEGGAAQAAGMRAGDRILSMDGERIYLFDEIYVFAQMSKGSPVQIAYERDGEKYETTLVPQYEESDGRYYYGFISTGMVDIKGLDGIKYAWYEVRAGVKNTYKSLLMLVTGKVARTEVAGPVGIANMVGEIYEETKENWLDVLVNMMNITMLLSVNLGIMNLLPLPALDGGRLVFLIVEVIRGKAIAPEKEGLVHLIGLVFFMVLMVFVFFNDIRNALL